MVVKQLPDCIHNLFTELQPKAFSLVILLLLKRTTFSRNPPGDFCSGPISSVVGHVSKFLAGWEAGKTRSGTSSPYQRLEGEGRVRKCLHGGKQCLPHRIKPCVLLKELTTSQTQRQSFFLTGRARWGEKVVPAPQRTTSSRYQEA